MLYCPVTGMLVSDGENETEPSPALLFCYLHEVGDFHYIRPDVEEKFQKVCAALEEEGNDDDDPYEVLLKREFQGEGAFLLMSLSYFGIACGPVWTTIDYCFDMNYTKEDEDTEQ